jgi:hypothetical protein
MKLPLLAYASSTKVKQSVGKYVEEEDFWPLQNFDSTGLL